MARGQRDGLEEDIFNYAVGTPTVGLCSGDYVNSISKLMYCGPRANNYTPGAPQTGVFIQYGRYSTSPSALSVPQNFSRARGNEPMGIHKSEKYSFIG